MIKVRQYKCPSCRHIFVAGDWQSGGVESVFCPYCGACLVLHMPATPREAIPKKQMDAIRYHINELHRLINE